MMVLLVRKSLKFWRDNVDGHRIYFYDGDCFVSGLRCGYYFLSRWIEEKKESARQLFIPEEIRRDEASLLVMRGYGTKRETDSAAD